MRPSIMPVSITRALGIPKSILRVQETIIYGYKISLSSSSLHSYKSKNTSFTKTKKRLIFMFKYDMINLYQLKGGNEMNKRKIIITQSLKPEYIEKIKNTVPDWEVIVGKEPTVWKQHAKDAEIIAGWTNELGDYCLVPGS